MFIERIALTVFGIWLFVLSVVVFTIFNKFRKLTREVKKGNLIRVLDKVIKAEAKNTKDIKKLTRNLNSLEEEVTLHVQKVGLIRFNPFDELGGDHSFSLALLDGVDTGVILTGLHTRERTRIYIKYIKKGKSEYELSKEEQKALLKAKKKNKT